MTTPLLIYNEINAGCFNSTACMDHGPVHVTVTGMILPFKSSSDSTKTSLVGGSASAPAVFDFIFEQHFHGFAEIFLVDLSHDLLPAGHRACAGGGFCLLRGRYRPCGGWRRCPLEGSNVPDAPHPVSGRRGRGTFP